MMIWIACLLVALLAALWLAWPFLRNTIVEGDGNEATVSIYADQALEVERDQAAGLISAEEARAALAEIDWRKSRAAKAISSGFSISKRAPLAALLAGIAVALMAFGGYWVTGTPEAQDQPLAARAQEQLEQRANAGDLTARIQLLIERSEKDPEDFETWWILARSHASVGDHAASAEAYRRAVMIRGDDPGVLSAYAEAMTLANGNKVPEGAEIIFSQVARDTADPRAFYYLALARAQRQDFKGALEDWTSLAKASDANAPWVPLVRRDIVNMVRFLKLDVTDYLEDASAAEIATAQGVAPEAHDLDSLRAAVEADAMDYDARMALIQALVGAGDPKGAAEQIAEAKTAFRAAPYLLSKIDETERSLGLDLVGDTGVGPTGEDVAAAMTMTEADRQDMIRGMVEGLAERLEDEPDDTDGWVMLIRSYRVLGDAKAANEALAKAEELFDGADTIKALLTSP